MPVHLFGRPAPLDGARRARRARSSRTRPRPSARQGSRTTGVASTFSFFPTKNLFGARRRRPRRTATTRSPSGSACCASTARATRRTSSSSATTRGSTSCRRRRCGSSCRTSTVEPLAARGRRALRRARSRRARASCRPTSRATSTTCTSSARPSATGSPRRWRTRGSAAPPYYVTPLHLQPALRYLGYARGRLPETEQAAAREPRAAAVGRDRRGRAGARRRDGSRSGLGRGSP